ncbi:MAG: bifunctional adenosylcobinamide kinase/adenosylcobinamide-phosphate guanylyltransferase [Bacilli bacterium]
MVVIIGGRCHGKLSFIENYTKNGIINNYHLLIDKHQSFLTYTMDNLNELSNKIIIVEEIGLGIVPLESSLRSKRDELGRVYQFLCSKADVVIRVWYGIPIYIKGDEEALKKKLINII